MGCVLCLLSLWVIHHIYPAFFYGKTVYYNLYDKSRLYRERKQYRVKILYQTLISIFALLFPFFSPLQLYIFTIKKRGTEKLRAYRYENSFPVEESECHVTSVIGLLMTM